MQDDPELALQVAPAHRESQDRAIHVRLPKGAAIVVADGAGGFGDGSLAAERVISALTDQLRLGSFERESLRWCSRLKEIDEQLYNEGIGETTAVVVFCIDRTVFGASVGDSGAWMISDKGIIDLTSHQQRKPLLGSGVAAVVPLGSDECEGTLLVATDGLFKYAPREKIQQIVLQASLEQAIADLIGLVRLPSGGLQDDVAVVLCR